MANEYVITGLPATTTAFVIERRISDENSEMKVWSTVTQGWVTWADADVANYYQPLTQDGTSGTFRGNTNAKKSDGPILAIYYSTSAHLEEGSETLVWVAGYLVPAGTITAKDTAKHRYMTRDLPPVPQGSAPVECWGVVDGYGAVIDLTDKVLRVVGYLVTDEQDEANFLDDVIAAAFKYEMDSGITLDPPNVVWLQYDAAKTASPGDYRYFLWNVTDNVVLATGRMPIKPAVKDT